MLEKDVENLIAMYPDDIFPGQNLSLVGQQYTIEGKRIDILFEDPHKRKIIVEVKRGILTRDASGQIAEYYGLLKARASDQFHEMILCANIIPAERRLFLETIGIECRELGIAYIGQLAAKHNYTFLDDRPDYTMVREPEIARKTDILECTDDDVSVWIFQGNPEIYDVANALSDAGIGNCIHWSVNQHRSRIRKGHIGLVWISGREAGIYVMTRIETDPAPMRESPEEMKYWLEQPKEADSVALRVEMTILRRFVNKPILKSRLREIPGLKGLSILRNSQGTNFPVRNSEWRMITQLF